MRNVDRAVCCSVEELKGENEFGLICDDAFRATGGDESLRGEEYDWGGRSGVGARGCRNELQRAYSKVFANSVA